jgi:hypothetical protein
LVGHPFDRLPASLWHQPDEMGFLESCSRRIRHEPRFLRRG